MKKAIAAILAALFITLAGCGKADTLPQSTAQLPQSSAEPTPGATPPATGANAEAGAGSRAEALLQEAIQAFEGKTWLVVGDSITEHNDITEKNYHDYIAEWLGLQVVNVSGSGIGYLEGYDGQPRFFDRLDMFPQQADLITVFGGTNDRDHPVGTFGDGDDWSMYGAADDFFRALTERYPTTPIGVLTPLPRAENWGEGIPFADHVDAIITMAGHYSLPVLDLYRESGLRPWNAVNNQLYFSNPQTPQGDGLHPNAAGHEVLARKILPFILEHLRPAA